MVRTTPPSNLMIDGFKILAIGGDETVTGFITCLGCVELGTNSPYLRFAIVAQNRVIAHYAIGLRSLQGRHSTGRSLFPSIH